MKTPKKTTALSSVKTFEIEIRTERKGLLNHMLTRKRTKAWDMQSEPSAADKYVYHHELDRAAFMQ